MSKFDEAIAEINKEFGVGSIIDLSAAPAKAEVISSGSTELDQALGIGGYPRGVIIEIFGPESAGKTSLALHACLEAQKYGKIAYVDAEHSLHNSIPYAQAIGLDLTNMALSQPFCGEEGLKIVETLVNTGEVALIIVDSVAALTPRAEIEGEMGQAHMGLQARMMSQACRKLAAIASKTKTTIIFINQLRMKIGVMYGNPEVTTGGNALKFYASVRLDVRKREVIENANKEIIGHRVEVKVVKNKLAPPLKKAEFNLIFGKGIDIEGEFLGTLLKAGVVTKNGAWWSVDELKTNKKEKVLEYVQAHKEVLEKRIF